jgi:hypothetical protein
MAITAVARRKRDPGGVGDGDRQHAPVLAGDELIGVYGEFPPSFRLRR